MKKIVNNVEVDVTAEELKVIEATKTEWKNGSLDRSMEELRIKRNSLLAQTDYLALSDQTMTAEMTTYRQALRDITNGLTTVEQINAVVWPEKPEV